MKIIKWLKLIIKIALSIIILIVIIDNIQTVQFNIIGLYHIQLPLIVLSIIFIIIGLIIGLLFGLSHHHTLNSRIRELENKVNDGR